MTFISKEHYFKNGWDCRKCDKMTEHKKEGKGVKAKQICTVCGTQANDQFVIEFQILCMC